MLVNKGRTNITFGWVLIALLSGSVVQFGGSNSSNSGAVLVVRPGCIQ